MKMRTIVLAAMVFAVSSAAYAQEPVVGVKDPEALFKDPEPTLNKQIVYSLDVVID